MDLYYPPRPKSKVEEYNLKLKERELYTNNILDRFTENGNGAPIRDENGNIVTRRKGILENSKHFDDDISQSQESQSQINNNNYKNENNVGGNDNYNQYEENEEQNDINNENNYSLANTLGQKRLNNNINYNPMQQESINFNNNVNNPNNLINNNNQIQPEEKEESKIIPQKNSNKDYNENYQGLGIIPRVSDFKQIQKKMGLDTIQDDLAKAIEEKRIKAEKEKQRQKELELKEDLKVRNAIEEEKRLLKIEKKKKEDEENRLRLLNLQNIEKNKKKKKLIDIDEYYGKDFRLFQKGKNKNKIEKSKEEEEAEVNNVNNPNINELEQTNNINAIEDIKQTKIDTLQAINNFTINVYKNRQLLENDIRKLKRDVRSQYIEMNDLFQKLKDTSDEVDYTNKALFQKSQLLKSQLLQSKIKNTLTKNLLDRNYDENMNVNAEELELKTNPNLASHNSNLPGTSDFLYFNEDTNPENDISSLAKAGKNIIELKGEGTMIPISEDNKSSNDLNDNDFIGKNKFGYNYWNDKEYLRKKQFYEDMHKECKMEDLYNDLKEIENINKNLAPMNKIQTIKNNFSVDYDRLLTKERMIKQKYKNKF